MDFKSLSKKYNVETIKEIISQKLQGVASRKIAKDLLGDKTKKTTVNNIFNRFMKSNLDVDEVGIEKPKILLLDIENSPIIAQVWSLFKNNYLGLNQIENDWYILSYAAKWYGDEKVIYNDCRDNLEDDSELLKELWGLLEEADYVVGHNSKGFDIPKIKARMLLNGMKPFSPIKHIDTMLIAKKQFNFTSNKLAYLTDKLCTKYKKLDHGKFAGHDLWMECLKGNPEAWREMEDYNIYDVLSLEELYEILLPWSTMSPNFNLYVDDNVIRCPCCNSKSIVKIDKLSETPVGLYDTYRCTDCGRVSRGSINLLDKDKRRSLLRNAI